MKMAVCWDVAKCSLVDTDRRFTGGYLIALMMKAVDTAQHPTRQQISDNDIMIM